MKIGWAAADITPDKPVNLRGQFHSRISTHVNDPLTATVLALEGNDLDGNTEQAILIACDRVSIPTVLHTRVCEALAERIPDFSPDKLVTNATHTHTAPVAVEGRYPPAGDGVMTPTEYADLFVERVTDAAVEAWNSRKPGAVSWAIGQAVVGHNRRAMYADGHSQMYGDTNAPDFECIEGYEDHSLNVLFTLDEDEELTGVIVNLACPSQETESEYYVSADFWHEAREALRERFHDGLFVLPQCSAAGDQSPHLLVNKAAEGRMIEQRGLTRREEIGRRIANGVADVYDIARGDIRSELPLQHVVRTLHLPARRITGEEYASNVTDLENLRKQQVDPTDVVAHSRHFVMTNRAKRVVDDYLVQADEPTYETEVHVIRLGDIAFATNQFELFLDFGLRIKARSKAVQTFLTQLASTRTGGDGTYLPTQRAVDARSYGAQATDNRVGPEGGQVLVEETLAMINGMFAEEGD